MQDQKPGTLTPSLRPQALPYLTAATVTLSITDTPAPLPGPFDPPPPGTAGGHALASGGETFHWDMGKLWHWGERDLFLPKVHAVGLFSDSAI